MKNRAKASREDATLHTYRPQYEIVAEKIVDFIASAQLQSGDRLPAEQKLGEQLGVSRNIVREAVKYLTATGLIAVRKGVGVYVAERSRLVAAPSTNFTMNVDPEHIQALFEFRCMQEMLTTRIATEHITVVELRELGKIVVANRAHAEAEAWEPFLKSDNAFHLAIAQATHNPFLVNTIENILHFQRWAVKIVTGGAPGSLRVSAEQHEAIFNAIKDGEPEEAAHAAKFHVESVLSAYKQETRRLLTNEL